MHSEKDGRVPPEGFVRCEEIFSMIDPFEENAGPFFVNMKEGRSGLWTDKKHCNGGGGVHGGLIATLADMNLFVGAFEDLQGSYGVTVTLNINYVAGVGEGEWLEAKSSVSRATSSLIFLQGEVYTKNGTIATFSGVIKRLKTSKL